MKKSTIIIVLVVLGFLLIGGIVYLKLSDTRNVSDNNENVNANTNDNTANEPELGEPTVLDSDDYAYKLYTKLSDYGKEIYDSKKYETYPKVDDQYFISLKQLRDDFKYDISMFKDEKGTVCDIEKSGIYFDVNHKSGIQLSDKVPPILTALFGCEVITESNKND